MEEKIKKLPKWAQDHINSLQRQNFDLLNENKLIKENYSGDGCVYFPLSGKTEDMQTKYNRVIFKKDEMQIEVSLSRQGRDPELEIMDISGKICIRPGVTNVVYIKSE